jgi:hypothetical protein
VAPHSPPAPCALAWSGVSPLLVCVHLSLISTPSCTVTFTASTCLSAAAYAAPSIRILVRAQVHQHPIAFSCLLIAAM